MSFNKDRIFEDSLFPFQNGVNWTEFFNGRALERYKVGGLSFVDYMLTQCHAFDVNPKLLVATLQREQGLISKRELKAKDLDRATGYGCTDSGDLPGITGFERQITGCLRTYRKFFDSWVPKTKMIVDVSALIMPENRFTYTLYKYCPHIGVNYSPQFAKYGPYGCFELYRIWRQFWPKDVV